MLHGVCRAQRVPICILMVMLLALSACQPMRGRTDQSANSTAHWIDPQATDPAIDDWLEPHIAIPPVSSPQGRLFVFLPGSFGQPRHQLLILEQAAISGYHAIGLRYPNRWTVNNLCEPTDDPACFEQTRSEILTGADRTPLITITPANSIHNRLIKLLTYLDATYPNEGWGQFLDATGAPRWSLISVGGHSQGGGHAALLGKQVALARVCIFSAPADSLLIKRQRIIAPWLSQAGATPSSSYYGLAHEQEGGFALIIQNWHALGMLGTSVSVDTQAVPYAGAQQLSTGLTPARPGEYHGSTVVDRNTPLLDDGRPVLAAVWGYLCFPPAS